MVRKRRKKNIEKWKKTKKWVEEKRKGKSELEGVAKKGRMGRSTGKRGNEL